MKKIFLMAVTFALALTSCEDFLDSQDYTGKNNTNFPSTSEDIDKMVAAVYKSTFYAPFQGNNLEQYFSIANIMSDDMFGGAGVGDPWWQALDKLKYAQTNQMQDLWTSAYEAISRANAALNVVGNIADTEKRAQTEGELRFMRAYSYYNLVLAFNNVPVIDKAPETVEEAQAVPAQVEGKEIFKLIAEDLYYATKNMPSYKYDKGNPWGGPVAFGKVTRWAAEAFLGRAFLFYTGFYGQSTMPFKQAIVVDPAKPEEKIAGIDKAYVENALKDCIDNSGHGLVSDYRSLWAYSNQYTAKDYDFVNDMIEKGTCYKEGNEEVLLAINFQYQAAWSANLHLTNQYGLFFGIRADNNDDGDARFFVGTPTSVYPFSTGWGCGSVATNLVNDWKVAEPNDPRRDASILDMSKTALKPETFSDGVELTMYHQKKITSVRSSGGEKRSWSLDAMGSEGNGNYQASNCTPLTLYRMADVYLMYAELKKDATYLNKVRQRVGLPDVEYTEDNLRNERRWELAFEGSRWDDLRRWHIAGDALSKQTGSAMYNQGVMTTMQYSDYKARYDATQGFYRIPKSQIELSGGKYKQNKGWENDAESTFAGY